MTGGDDRRGAGRTAARIGAVALTLALAVGGACRDEPAAPSPARPAAAPTTVDSPAAPTTVDSPAPPALEKGVGDAYHAVLDLVTCEAVALRECRGERWRFPAGTARVWALATVRNRDARGRVTLRWRRGDEVVRSVPLHVGKNPRWRTWSFLDIPEDGGGWWTVEVLRVDGEMMARRRFLVDAAAPGPTGASPDGADDAAARGAP